MKKFYLTKCIPGQGNREINHHFSSTKDPAASIRYFNEYGHLVHESVQLDVKGYQKTAEGITYTITEEFDAFSTSTGN